MGRLCRRGCEEAGFCHASAVFLKPNKRKDAATTSQQLPSRLVRERTCSCPELLDSDMILSRRDRYAEPKANVFRLSRIEVEKSRAFNGDLFGRRSAIGRVCFLRLDSILLRVAPHLMGRLDRDARGPLVDARLVGRQSVCAGQRLLAERLRLSMALVARLEGRRSHAIGARAGACALFIARSTVQKLNKKPTVSKPEQHFSAFRPVHGAGASERRWATSISSACGNQPFTRGANGGAAPPLRNSAR